MTQTGILVLLALALARGFRPVVGPAWYAGGAGWGILLLVLLVLAMRM